MSEEQLLVTLGVKDANCTSKVKELNKEIKSLDTIYKKTSETSKDFENSVEGLKTKLDYLSKKYDANKAKLSAYKEQMSKAKEMVSKKKEELEKLKKSEGDNTVAIQKAEKQLEKYQTQMNNANRNINETEAELKSLDNQIKDTNEALKNNNAKQFGSDMRVAAENTETLGDRVKSVGDGISNLGRGVSVVSASIIGLAKKSIDSFNEVDDGADNLIKATGATGENAQKLIEVYNKLNSESKASFDEVGSALGEVNTRFGYTEEQAEKCTLSFLHFADITNTNATQAVQLVSRAMGDAGINSEEYAEVLDNLALAAQASGISVDKLTENLTKYGAPMRALGFDMKESIALFSSWEKAGVNTEIAFSGMKKAISNWGSAGKDSRKEFKKTLEEIKKCPDIASATTKAIEVFGQKAGSDLADAIQGGRFEYEEFLKIIQNSKGTVENTYNEINEGEEQNEIAIKNAKLALAELGQTVLKEVTPIVKDLTEVIKKVADWFKNLDDSTKQNIMNFAKIAVVAGPALMFFGKLTKIAGSAVNLFSKLGSGAKSLTNFFKGTSQATAGVGAEISETAKSGINLAKKLSTLKEVGVATGGAWLALGTAMKATKTISDLHNKSILETTDDMSIFEKAINNLVDNGFHKSKKELQDMGLVYKDFNQNVSPEFQKEVETSASNIRDLALEIEKVKIDNIVTEEEKENLKQRVDNMCKEAIETIQSHSEEGKKALKKMFNADGVIDEKEQELLNNDSSQKIIDKIQKIQNEVDKEIEKGADLNSQTVKDKMAEVQQLKLDLLAENTSEEINYRENFAERVNKLDLESIEKALTDYRAKLDEKNQIIHDTYDKGIEYAEEMSEKTVGADRKTWQETLKTYKEARDKEIAQNEEFYSKFVETCIDGNENARKSINMITGKILSEDEQKSQERLINVKKMYAGLDKITEDGCYMLYNNQTNTMEKVAVTVDENSKKITGIWESSQNIVGECADGMGLKAKELASKTQDTAYSIEEANKLMQDCTINASNQIVDKNGNVIASLQDVKTNSDGTKDAIVNLNGNTIDVKINADNTIDKLKTIRYEMNAINSTKIAINAINAVNSGLEQLTKKGYASGTNNATKGIHLVGENGPELVYFSGGETVLNAEKTRNIITSGGYLNPNTIESTQLLNTSNVYNNNIYNNSNIDMNTLGNIIANAVTSAISSLSIQMDTQKVAEIVDNQTGRNTAWERRFNGC